MGSNADIIHCRPIRSHKPAAVFVLADNRLVRESLSHLLRKRGDASVVGECAYTDSAVEQVASACCDVLLLDESTRINSGTDLVGRLLETVDCLKIILLGVEDNEHTFLEAVRSGVVGYLLKEASAPDVLLAIRAVTQGEAVCPAHLTRLLFRYVNRVAKSAPIYRLKSNLGLTSRQQQLVSLLAKGWTNKEIANSLNLSEQTVKNHIHRILRQVNAEDRYQAVEAVRACAPFA